MRPDATTLPPWHELIDDPDDGRVAGLTARLAALDGPADERGEWPEEAWSALVESGAPRWALPRFFGGEECERSLALGRYARVAEGSLTAAFVLSQHDAAVRRLARSSEHRCAAAWLELIGDDEAFATVGISQLTTSRRHGANALVAHEGSHAGGGFTLHGVMPWVTAAEMADVIVTGAALADGRNVLLAVPTDRPGLTVRPPFALAALQASCTSEVVCDGVYVVEADRLAGPSADVLSDPGQAGTGGLETSALALGQARAALAALRAEAPRRADLVEPAESLAASWRDAWRALNDAANAAPDAPTPAQVRAQANALVLRATQAFLTAHKGSGFLRAEPAQRWARQALFFLVWSCPGAVAQATLRDLAGLCDA